MGKLEKSSKVEREAEAIVLDLKATKNPHLLIGVDAEGNKVSQHGTKLGRPRRIKELGLTKAQMRALYDAAFDHNAADIFRVLFELAQNDKDLLKFVIEQRIGKPAQTLSGDDSAPLTLIVRRGIDDNNTDTGSHKE